MECVKCGENITTAKCSKCKFDFVNDEVIFLFPLNKKNISSFAKVVKSDDIKKANHTENILYNHIPLKEKLTNNANLQSNETAGKSKGILITSLIGTIIWFFAFAICAAVVYKNVNEILFIITTLTIMLVLSFMLVDRIAAISHCGKTIDLRKTKLINWITNVSYYVSIIMISITSCVTLFPIGGNVMKEISETSLSADTITVLNTISTVVVCVGTLILAVLIWKKTNSTVSNITLFATMISPAAFVSLIAVATGLVMLILYLVATLVTVLIAVIGIAIVVGVVYLLIKYVNQ